MNKHFLEMKSDALVTEDGASCIWRWFGDDSSSGITGEGTFHAETREKEFNEFSCSNGLSLTKDNEGF